jgi:predicted RNase H-like HicB family nuclease
MAEAIAIQNRQVTETITLTVTLHAFVRKEAKLRWVAVCPALGVASQGIDAEDAKRSVHEAVELWFESCVERGVLDQALREANFRPLPPDEQLPDDCEHVVVRPTQDVRGDLFPLNITIPAYQAAAFLSASV